MQDVRLGRFFAVDPLEKAFHWNSPYAFSENRVIDAFELEGAESVLMHGTLGPGQDSYELKKRFWLRNLAFEFTNRHDYLSGEWNGLGYSPVFVQIAAYNIYVKIIEHRKSNSLIKEPIFVLGHSHSGNVGIKVVNYLNEYYEEHAKTTYRPNITLVTLNTPHLASVELNKKSKNVHLNIFTDDDNLSGIGQINDYPPLHIISPFMGQAYETADVNINYGKDQDEDFFGTWDHNGISLNNYKKWKPLLDQGLDDWNKRLEEMRKGLQDLKNDLKIKSKTIVQDNTRVKSKKMTKKQNNDRKIMQSPRYF
jgi:hypothetical protein